MVGKKPTALVVTFIAIATGVLVNGIFMYLDLMSANTSGMSGGYPEWLVAIIVLVLLRHQCRVFFIDLKIFDALPTKKRKFALSIVYVSALMGTLFMPLFGWHAFYGSLVICAYYALFIIFTPVIRVGGPKDETFNMIGTLVADVSALIFWVMISTHLVYENNPIKTDDIIILALVIHFVLTWQFHNEYLSPLKQILQHYWRVLTGDEPITPALTLVEERGWAVREQEFSASNVSDITIPEK